MEAAAIGVIKPPLYDAIAAFKLAAAAVTCACVDEELVNTD